MDNIVAIYADGGVIGRNPSEIGGVWAFCGIDADGNRVVEQGGVVEVTPSWKLVTNNHTEQIAICKAMEAMPAGWSGAVCSDSKIALGRVFEEWGTKNLPAIISKRCALALGRLGELKPVLLQGHPTAEDLERGIGAKRGLPVSIHNVWCDTRCNEEKEKFLRGRVLDPILNFIRTEEPCTVQQLSRQLGRPIKDIDEGISRLIAMKAIRRELTEGAPMRELLYIGNS